MATYPIYFGIEELHRIATSSTVMFDVETLGLQPKLGGLRLIQLFGVQTRCTVVIDYFDLTDEGIDKLKNFFNTPRFWVAHNAVFDLGWLQEHGIYPLPLVEEKDSKAKTLGGNIRCTLLASRLVSNGNRDSSNRNLKHSLAHIVSRYLGKEISKEHQKSDWGAKELSEEQIEYAVTDVEVLADLDILLQAKLQEHNLLHAYYLECEALPALAQMWRIGLPWNLNDLEACRKDYEFDVRTRGEEFLIKLDQAMPKEHKIPRDIPRDKEEKLKRLNDLLTQTGKPADIRERWELEKEEIEQDIELAPFNLRSKDEGSIREGTKKYRGFNINSPKQLLDKFEILLGKVPLDAKGKPSTSRPALRAYAADHELVQMYLGWKKAEKRRQMIKSIQEKADSDGFVRASYLQLGADTGRMSCISPNNQQIPRDDNFRGCVQAPVGWVLVDADYGQMELRLAAALSKDEKMIEAFINNEDLHEVTAKAIGCDRQIAKSANFGLLYGAGAEGLRNYAGASGITMTLEQAVNIRDEWLKTYSGIQRWQQANAVAAFEQENAYIASKKKCLPTVHIPLTNMRRYLIEDLNKVTVRCNTPVQGAGAAILKYALVKLWPIIRDTGEDIVKLCGAVHDEIILLVKEGKEEEWAEILKTKMESAERMWLGEVPPLAEVHIGKSWSDVH